MACRCLGRKEGRKEGSHPGSRSPTGQPLPAQGHTSHLPRHKPGESHGVQSWRAGAEAGQQSQRLVRGCQKGPEWQGQPAFPLVPCRNGAGARRPPCGRVNVPSLRRTPSLRTGSQFPSSKKPKPHGRTSTLLNKVLFKREVREG